MPFYFIVGIFADSVRFDADIKRKVGMFGGFAPWVIRCRCKGSVFLTRSFGEGLLGGCLAEKKRTAFVP